MNLLGLRATALLIVIAAHFAQAAPFLVYFPYFEIATYGVGMLFLMSGYAIDFALRHVDNYRAFLFRRWARLFPAMAVCSLTTVAVLALLGAPDRPALLDLLPSWSFVAPELWHALTGLPFGWVDMVYWCLYVEALFYLVVGALYFSRSRARAIDILFAIFLLGLALKAASLVVGGSLSEAHDWVRVHVPVIRYASYFVIGMLLARSTRAPLSAWPRAMLIACVCAEIAYPAAAGLPHVSPFIAGLLLLFYAGMFTPRGRAIFASRALAPIGYASYPLFLIHCGIGIAAIEASGATGLTALLVAVAVLAALLGFSMLVQRYVADPARRWLLRARRDDAVDVGPFAVAR